MIPNYIVLVTLLALFTVETFFVARWLAPLRARASRRRRRRRIPIFSPQW